ncbi:hypothetical protein DMUE_5600 [Dictyocoela muelleri]|nr:hypothetical protein DMUE_5600 [Dictyocoela muelleri]
MIVGLAYVPIDKLHIEVKKLDDYFSNNNFNDIQIIWEVIKKTYCNNINDINSCPENIFSPAFWSVADRILNNASITTNCLEGWHRSLNNNFIRAHPSLLEFGNELKKQHAQVENKINQLFLQRYPINSNINIHMASIINDYESYIGIQFLKVISSNLKLKNNFD